MSTLLAILTTSTVGLVVGVELAVAFVLNPIMIRLPAGASIAARADGGRMLGRAMPFWYIGSLILTVALAVLTWGTETAAMALVAAGLLVVSVVMSIVFLVPINNRSSTWTAEVHPADWREQQQRWDRLHYGRLAIIGAAFVLIAAAVAVL